MSNKNLRNVLSKFATGVTIVSTVDHDGKLVGMTANSFTSVSLDPPLVLWSIGINQPSYDIFLKAKGYSVSILSKDQKDICNLFSSSIDNKFNSVDYVLSDNGFPIIKKSLAWFDCLKWNNYPGGDHQILVGEVKNFCSNENDPLIFWNGSLA
jgi:flavin reductase (DIM6/NTAB) family NADH-FMN oxidoreductase RutF